MAIVVRFAFVLIAGLLLAAGPALSAGGGGSSSSNSAGYERDKDYIKAADLAEKGRYDQAIPLLEKYVAENPKSADGFNYLGYSHRKLGRFDEALANYQMALKLQPQHRGANEYLGELYLEMGDLAKAEERLEVLDDACFFGCEEYTELKEAISDYKVRNGGG